jgi:NTE family protein
VIAGPVPRSARGPSNFDLALGASQILMRQIARLKRDRHPGRRPPDIYIEPLLDRFRVLEFFRAEEILAAAAPAKDDDSSASLRPIWRRRQPFGLGREGE